jgi:hypothetical protein
MSFSSKGHSDASSFIPFNKKSIYSYSQSNLPAKKMKYDKKNSNVVSENGLLGSNNSYSENLLLKQQKLRRSSTKST